MVTALSRGTVALGRWAAERAEGDPDVSARPLWAVIAGEVDAHRDDLEDRTPSPDDVPMFDTPA